jgi:nicotinate dehydrogenase subunit A
LYWANPKEAGLPRTIEFTLNGAAATVSAEETDLLLDVLRGPLALHGARFGCGAGQCGACAVLVDGRAVMSCGTEIGAVAGRAVTTVEGLGTPQAPHPLQAAFLELQAGQCGYCLSGLLVGAAALLAANADPSRAEIAAALDGHLCRCGVHNRVLDAVALAARRMRAAANAGVPA